MKLRRFLWLAAFASALVAAAAGLRQQTPTSAAGEEYGALAPELPEQLNAITNISLSDSSKETLIKREKLGHWVVREMDEYPADKEKIRAMLYRLAQSRNMEKKTADPRLFDRLGLAEKSARRLRLSIGHTGSPVLALLSGNYDEVFKGTYVRAEGDNQSWLASGDLTFDPAPLAWVEREILRVDQSRIWQVRIRHADTETELAINRKNIAGDFVLEDREVTNYYALYNVANALEHLQLAHAMRGEKLPGSPAQTALFRTMDGLEVEIRLAPDGDAKNQHWAKISARFVAAAAQKEDENATKIGHAPEDVKKEAAAINARTGAWVYTLTPEAYALLITKPSALLKEKGTSPTKE
jgi:hypothetical protein